MAVVVIAEDDEDIALVLVRLLKRAGHTVLRAVDGVEALDLAMEHRPDVVLTDLGMPRMDGYELTRAIRADPDLADTPVIMLSGHLHPGDTKPYETGVCAVLLKPCPNDTLRAVVQEMADRGPHSHDGSGHSGAECPAGRPVTA
jgi:CheY-like chemotaxis protein